MKLATFYEGVELHREDKIVYARFLTPHRILSTCQAAGGEQESLDYLYNHQSCEPGGHALSDEIHEMAVHRPREYREHIASRYHLPADKCATLSTAANMYHIAIKRAAHEHLEVIAACTGGVETNAGRAGDQASYVQDAGQFKMLRDNGKAPSPTSGTIVTMLFVSHELTPGAMVTAVITATEAKSAVLQELGIPSRYSDGLATGTGTDQIAVATRLGSTTPLTDAGKHSKLGELIGKAVHDAIKETLATQNHLSSLSQSSILRHIERFGANRETMVNGICAHLSPEDGALINRNFLVTDGHPLTVAAVAALVHLRDKLVWGILPESCLQEVLVIQAAQIAMAVSGKIDRFPAYIEQLANESLSLDNGVLLGLIYRAIALGFAEKWQ